jgi:outer membrane receptor protein involved in Fe transport
MRCNDTSKNFSVKHRHSRIVAAGLAGVGLSIAWPSIALAQAEAPAPSSHTSSDNAATQDIIVTAGKREQVLSKVAEGISVVTGKQIDLRGAKSLTDYLALTPGVSLQSIGAPGWGWVEIRGISPQSVGATVATYVDEIPVGATSALTRSGEYTPDLDPSDLARVEVLKGPQGTIYGAAALGGVIKYVTKGPNLQKTEIDTTEELNFLNNGQPGTELRAAISTPLITDTLGIRVSGFYRHDAGFVDQLGPQGVARNNANYGNTWGFRGALRWLPTSNLTVDLTGSIENSITHGYAVVDLDPLTFKPLFGPKDSTYRALNEGFRVKTEMLTGTVKWKTGLGTLTSASSYSYQAPGETGDITLFYTPTLPGQPQDPNGFVNYAHPGGEIGIHSDKKTTEELRFNSDRLGPFEVTAGGFYQHEKLKDGAEYLTYLPSGGLIDPNAPPLGVAWRYGTLSEYAGFINVTAYLADRLDVTGGYRHSRITQTRILDREGPLFAGDSATDSQSFADNSDTYLAGIRWRPTDTLMVYARAASGYRPGGGRSVPPGAPADFALTYKPDSIWSYEAGVKYRSPSGKLTLDVDGFWIDWKDIQTLVFVGRYSTDGNGGKARSRGFEAQGQYTPFRGFTINANTAYTDARFTEDAPDIGVTKGEEIYQVPKWTATVGLDYEWALNDRIKAYLGGSYEYKSSQLDFSLLRLPAYVSINLHAGIETEHHQVNFYIKNLTNKNIFIGDSSGYYPEFPPFEPVISQPRQFGISFSQKF